MSNKGNFHVLSTLCSECHIVSCTKTCQYNGPLAGALDSVQSSTLMPSTEHPTNNSNAAKINIVPSFAYPDHDDSNLNSSDANVSSETEKPHTELSYKYRGIHIANLNIRHLKPKLDDLKFLLDNANCIDVFGICETFLNNTIDDEILNINGYKFERKDRDKCDQILSDKGGGILIYIGNQVNYIRRHDLESADVESIWIEVKIINSKSFLICSVYRPPHLNLNGLKTFPVNLKNRYLQAMKFM